MEDEKQGFARRLAESLGHAGYPLKPAVVAREFNLRYWGRPVSLQAVRKWLRGEAIPTQDKLMALAEWLGITPQALRFGRQIDERLERKAASWNEAMNYRERELFEAILSLSPEHRKLVREFVTALVKAYPPQEKGGSR